MTILGGIDFSDVYDYYYYINRYPDLKAAFGDDDIAALQHFASSGIQEGRHGKEQYDPYFGENFYNDAFNCNIDYKKLLSGIDCQTLFMKANTKIGDDGIIMGALTDEDLNQVTELIKNIKVEYFNCGHGIHNEKKKDFVKSVSETLKK